MSAASRQEDAFQAYLTLGPGRNLRDLRRVLVERAPVRGRPPSLRTLEGWSSRYRWQERIADIERRARAEQEQEHVEWVKQHRARLRREGLLLQEMGLRWLGEKESGNVSAREAIGALDAGFKFEALALGEATQRVVVDEDDDERLKGLTDDELRSLLREIRAHAARGGSRAGEAPPG